MTKPQYLQKEKQLTQITSIKSDKSTRSSFWKSENTEKKNHINETYVINLSVKIS
jgi:hypothetical protein